VRDQRRPWRRHGRSNSGPAVDARLTNAVRFSDALAQGADLQFTPVALSGDDLLFLQYTGGTTACARVRRSRTAT